MFKRRSTEKPDLPKEYVWELDYDGDIRIYKCVVTETMVTTYEGDVEKKHLKIMNPECREGVLQIDTITSIYGEQIPFQLERFIPYIKLETGWKSSDTTKQDRLDATVKMHKRNSALQVVLGILCIIGTQVKKAITGEVGDWFMLNAFGIFFIFAAIYTMLRLKLELNQLKEAEEEAAAAAAAAKQLPEETAQAENVKEATDEEKEEAPSGRLEGLKPRK